jgi:prepilin-type N-terminal cleavage/methylation domain-containing protein/prepilin-type processing-associated H-X9-DG protein
MMDRTHQGGPRRAAFTLIELLVVIAIIAILAAMLVPAVQQALDTARAAACNSNQRQIGIGTTAFANEHQGGMPYSWNFFIHEGWCHELEGYAVDKAMGSKLWVCPAVRYTDDPSFFIPISHYAASYPATLSTGYNGVEMARRSNIDFTMPTQAVLLGDAPGQVPGHPTQFSYYTFWHLRFNVVRGFPDRPVSLPPGSLSIPDFRHRERAQFLFVDGHMEGLKPGELLRKHFQVDPIRQMAGKSSSIRPATSVSTR